MIPITVQHLIADQSGEGIALKIIYLDQNKWVALARAVKYPAENPEVRAVLEKLCQVLEAGHVVLPLTASNIYETHKINVKERRFDLAYTQATVSQGTVFRGRHRRLEVEVIDAVRGAYGMPKIARDGTWFLSNVFFESFAEWGDARLGNKISEKVIDVIRHDPAFFLFNYLMETPEAVRITGVARFSEGSEQLRQRIEERRKRHAGESLSMRRKIQNVLLMSNEIDLIRAFAGQAGIPNIGPDEILRLTARRIMNDIPTYVIEREIALRIESQQNRPIDENDFRDMQAFCAVVAYADVVVAENQFANLARQAKLDKKFGTQIMTNILELKDHL